MYLLLILFVSIYALPTPWTSDLENNLSQDIEILETSTAAPKDKYKFSFSKPFSLMADFITDGLLAGVSILDDAVPKINSPNAEKLQESAENFTSSAWHEEVSPLFEDLIISTELIPGSTFNVSNNFPNENSTDVITSTSFDATIDVTYENITETIENDNSTTGNNVTSNERQVAVGDNDVNNEVEQVDVPSKENTATTTTETSVGAKQENGSEESEESEEETDFVQGLISSFLSGLSTPEGGVDVEALVGLIGGLSVPRGDGTYDFTGLTETLQSFFGGGENGGGGSDVGKFLGGLVAAFIQGVAKPPGGKGAGILAGNLITSILPGLSAPPPPPEVSTKPKPEQGLDSAGFFQGLLKSVLSGSSGGNNKNQTMTNGWNKPIISIKQTLFKSVFTLISSVVSKVSKPGWN